MKRLLALFALALTALPAQAQLAGLDAGVYGSWWKPEDLDKGYGGGAVVRGQLLEFLGFDARAGYFSFGDPDVDMVPVEIAAMLRFPLPVISFFGGVGGGYYTFSGEDGFSLDDETGAFANLGVEGALGDWLVFVEWRYQILKADVDQAGGGFAEGDEIDFGGSGFSLGLTYRF